MLDKRARILTIHGQNTKNRRTMETFRLPVEFDKCERYHDKHDTIKR